ncbi:MAG: hypothetical protein ABTQ29_11390 [Siculibacillus sp.]
MSVVGESVVVMVAGSGLVTETVEKIRVSRRDRRLVRAALLIIGMLAVTDAVLYLGRLI